MAWNERDRDRDRKRREQGEGREGKGATRRVEGPSGRRRAAEGRWGRSL